MNSIPLKDRRFIMMEGDVEIVRAKEKEPELNKHVQKFLNKLFGVNHDN